ncbi:MAG: type II secretion system protein [Kiritimatiellales bacterium]
MNSELQRGFTLVELLVALTVFGILAAALTGIVRNAMDSVVQAQKSVADTMRLRALESMLGDALRAAESVTLSMQEQRLLSETNEYDVEEGTIRFRGEMQSLGFCLPRPFLKPERDGYLHWITLNISQNETSELFELKLRDVSFLCEVDNPVGDDCDWKGISGTVDERLPVLEADLIRTATALNFSYWIYNEESGEPVEMEPDEIAGNYALAVPDFIELKIQLPNGAPEIFRFNYAVKGKIL